MKFKYNQLNLHIFIKSITAILFLLIVYLINTIYNSQKNLFEYNMYIIQNDIENNKYEDVLVGTNSHASIFELLNSKLSKKDINTVNLYTGLCLIKLEMYKESLSYLLKVKTKEQLINILLNKLIGDCYTELKNYDEAIKYFNKSIDIENSSPKINIDTVYKLALVYEEKGNFTEAYNLLKKYIKKYNKETDILILKNEKKKIKLILNKLIKKK